MEGHEGHKGHFVPQFTELEESLDAMTESPPSYTEATRFEDLDQKGSGELPPDSEKHLLDILQDLPQDFHEHLPEDPGDHPRDFQHDSSEGHGDFPWEFHEHLLEDSNDFPKRIYQLANEHRDRGDLPKDSPLSLKVFPFKLREPQVPSNAHVLKHLLKGKKMITIYSTQYKEKDMVDSTRLVIVEVLRK